MIKLGAQFLAAGIIAWFGRLQIYSLPVRRHDGRLELA